MGLEKTEFGTVCKTHANAVINLTDLISGPLSRESIMKLADTHFRYAPCIRRLSFTGNEVEEIPTEFVKRFTRVRSLAFNNMKKLKALPEGVGEMNFLTNCYLSNVGITKLPDSFEKLGNLKSLVLQNVDLESFGRKSPENSRLREIRCVVSPLKSFSWCTMYHLKELELMHVALNDLPVEFGDLQSLENLNIRGVSWADEILPKIRGSNEDATLQVIFEKAMEENVALDPENLFNKCISDETRTEIRKLVKANEFDKACARLFLEIPRFGLGYSDEGKLAEFGGFPPPIFKLTRLKHLTITFHAVRHLPKAVEHLMFLETLNLNHNPLLTSLPGELSKLRKLKQLSVRRCQSLKTPPPEIVSRGFNAIRSYLKFLGSDQVECRRTKLMLVGLGGAGKTSLLRALMADDNKTKTINEKEITDGIDIGKWTLRMDDGTDVQFSTWDFAGQSVYYNTHQFFLSKRAVYLMLWTVRLGYEHAGLDFWLSSITCHAPDAPIFVVGTHCDQVAKYEVPMEELKKRYPQIAGFHFVSSVTGQGISELKKNLMTRTLEQKYMGEKIPKVILDLEQIVKLKRREGDIVDWTTMKEMALKAGLYEEKDIKQAVQFLHDLGSIQYFDTEFLKDNVVINSQWIVDVMACVVSVKDSPIKHGVLYHKDIPQIWESFSDDLHQWMLRLTQEFDLTFPMLGSEVKEPANIVPCLLPDKEPELEWPVIEEKSDEKEARISYNFSYLPAGLFNRIQVRLFEFSDGKTIWKRGSRLRKNGHLAVVRQEDEFTLVVQVQGPRPENIVFLVHEVIDGLIKESFQGVMYDQCLPCPDCIYSRYFQDHAVFNVSLIRRAIEKKAPFLQCHRDFHFVSLSTLTAMVPPSSESDFDTQLKESLLNLSQMSTAMASGVSLSYLSSDFSDNPCVKPDELVKLIEGEGFECTNLSGMSPQKLYMSLRETLLLVVLLSRTYAEHKDMKSVLRYAIQIQKKPVLIVCVGESKNWEDSEIGMQIGQKEVYVDMTEKKRAVIDSKKQEFKRRLNKKLSGATEESESSQVFISYTWSNSHAANRSGQGKKENALGWEGGDPRHLREVLREAGIGCWIDVERTGARGLFEDISLGLRQAKVIVACISSEYKDSENCMAELRYGALTLKKPVIYVIVGRDDDWKFDELGFIMLKAQGTQINMQKESKNAHEALVAEVKQILSQKVDDSIRSRPKTAGANRGNSKQQDSLTQSFQEEYELAQTKFMKQVAFFATVSTSQLYPRIVVLDLMPTDEELEDEAKVTEIDWNKHNVSFRILCENQRGWHVVGDPIPFAGDQTARLLLVSSAAPYLIRVYALMRISGVHLHCLGEDNGFFEYVKAQSGTSSISTKEAYASLINAAIEVDEELVMGGLERCHLSSGKMLWLCKKHQQSGNGRVTVIPKDTSGGQEVHQSLVFDGDNRMLDRVLEMSEFELKLHRKTYKENIERHLAHKGGKAKRADPPSPQRPTLRRQSTSFMLIQSAVTDPNQTESRPLRPKTGRGRRMEKSALPSVDEEVPKPAPRGPRQKPPTPQNRTSTRASSRAGSVASSVPPPSQTAANPDSVQSKACLIL